MRRRVEKEAGWLDVRTVARMLGVHENTVRRWSNLGMLTAYRMGVGIGRRKFKREDVEKYISDHKEDWKMMDRGL